MPYVFDNNSIRVLSNYYPERFPSFWKSFDQLVSNAQVISVREVRNELDNLVTQEWLRDWISRNRAMFLTPTAEDTESVAEIFAVNHFRALVGAKQILKGMPVADPWIVACAKVRQGCVVTEEAWKENAAKIPNVCKHFGIDCTNVEGFLANEGMTF